VLTIRHGDCRHVLAELPAQSVHCCVTSPPYFGLRDYGVAGQIGLEPTPDAYVAELVAVFHKVRRVLRDDGTLWLNLGDSYATSGTRGYNGGSIVPRDMADAQAMGYRRTPLGLKEKDLLGIPWRVAFALQADGWYLRQDIIWSKPNPMPESVTDRCTKAHEYIFLMSKSARYFYDAAAIAEPSITVGKTPDERRAAGNYGIKNSVTIQAGIAMPSLAPGINGRNKRSVWEVASQPFAEAHFATFPPDLIEPCIKAGCPVGGTVLDPFGGAGTTGLVADRLGRNALLIELNPAYAGMAENRLRDDAGMFADIAC
jgi:DNA modification methylase